MKTREILARTAAGAIALIALVGLIIQARTSFSDRDFGAALWGMAFYFTDISNFMLVLLFGAIALGVDRLASSFFLAGASLTMAMVGVIYVLLLKVELQGAAAIGDFMLHTATPILVPLYWLLFARKGSLRWLDPGLWCAVPLVYLAYALWRGSVESRYPYFFIDIGKIGWERSFINALLISIGYFICGFALVLLDRVLGRLQPRGQT